MLNRAGLVNLSACFVLSRSVFVLQEHRDHQHKCETASHVTKVPRQPAVWCRVRPERWVCAVSTTCRVLSKIRGRRETQGDDSIYVHCACVLHHLLRSTVSPHLLLRHNPWSIVSDEIDFRCCRKRLTLNIRHTLLQDLIQNLGVLQLLLDLGNDRIGQLLLLASLDLALVADPRLENALRLGGEGGLLLELVGLSLKLGGFL